MIIPRFSLRWLLALLTVCGGLSLVLSYAVREQPWAIGISVALASLLVLFALHGATFSVAWLLTQLGYLFAGPRGKPGDGQSPFASAVSLASTSQAADPEPPAIMS